MNSLLEKADRLITEELALVRKTLPETAYSKEEADILLDGIREHLLAELNEGAIKDLTDVEHRLSEIVGDISLMEPETHPQTGSKPSGMMSLTIAIAVVALIVFGSIITSALGGDGGSVMVMTAIFGLPVSLILGWINRHTRNGKAALVVSAVTAVILLILIVAIFLGA